MYYTDERNKFIKALNEYFGYEIQDTQQFKQDYKEDYVLESQTENLLNFLLWYERKLGR